MSGVFSTMLEKSMFTSTPFWQVWSVCVENCSLLEMKGRAGCSVLQAAANHLVNSSLYGTFCETFVRISCTIPPKAMNTGLPRSSTTIRQFWLMRLFMVSPATRNVGYAAASNCIRRAVYLLKNWIANCLVSHSGCV